ncbi:MAG: three-Cys-motif partner protein TcmP [Candidatus Eremiobacterota bacterium]
MSNEEQWNLDKRPHTRTKLEIFRKYSYVWLTIWNKKNLFANQWYYIDLFAGRGNHTYRGEVVYGSPLIFLEQINNKLTSTSSKLRKEIKINIFLVEKNKENFNYLENNINSFMNEHSILKDCVKIYTFNDDCNIAIDNILENIINDPRNPLLAIIDPYGIKIKATTTKKIVLLKNPKEIFFNYILEGVRRVAGVEKKSHLKDSLTEKEISTIETFYDFMGRSKDTIDKDDIDILTDFVEEIFLGRQLKVIAYDMKYFDRKDVLYYLLFATKKGNIKDIIRKIFKKQKEQISGPDLFEQEFLEFGE